MKYEAEQTSYKNFTQNGNTIDLFDLYVLFFTNSHHVMFSSEFAFMSFYIFFVNKKHTVS